VTDGRRRWSELSPDQRAGIIGAAIVQFTLLAAALRDLHGRTPDEVRGPKGLWAAASFVNFVGPTAYFLFGRHRRT
jgi:hypothetical protein